MGSLIKKILLMGATWKPTDIGGCVFWLRSDLAWQDAAKTVPCTDSSLIWTGGDKTGLGHDVVQATEAKRPIYFTNQINGHPAWRVDGIDDYLKAVAFTWNQPECIYIVFKPVTWLSNACIFDGNAGNSLRFFQLAIDSVEKYTIYPTPEYNASGKGITIANGTVVVVRVRFTNVNHGLRKNNDIEVTYATAAGNAGGFTLGAYGDGGYYSNFDFVEAIGYDNVPSSEEDASIMNYLNGRYAIY